MSCQMLVAHPTAFCAHISDWPGVSFCSICTTLSPSTLYALTTAMASRSLTQLEQVLPGAIGGTGLSLSRLTTASAEILPIALATLPDFGTGRPIVESPMTWMFLCFTDSYVR